MQALKRLKDTGVAIVCYSLQGLKLSHAPVRAGQQIEATSGFVVLSGCFYCMHQALHLSGERLTDCYLKLIFIHEGSIIKAPDDIRLHFRADDVEGTKYDEHVTINGEGPPTPAPLRAVPPAYCRTMSMPARLNQIA